MVSSRAGLLALLAAAVLTMSFPDGGRADTTLTVSGIGTQVGAINTHVDSVTYSAPELVQAPGFGEAYEVRGSVSGVGWGGAGIVARARNAHYQYSVPFVARWRKHGKSHDLVTFHHGGGPAMVAVLQVERQLGTANQHRSAQLAGDLVVGAPALLNHSAYASANRRGLQGDGTFSAAYLLSEVAPLTQAEVDALRGQIAPGDPSYHFPGLAAGAPVPLSPAVDTATFRDVSRAMEQLVAGFLGRPFRTRICAGTSAGSVVGAGIAFGASPIGLLSVRTGGNYVIPYDPHSPRIFDGFLFNGFVYNSDTPRADAAQPISAPVFFIQGRADERYQQPIRMAHELFQKGVLLEDWIRIYEVKGLSHITRDSRETVQPSNGDRLGCFYSAGIRNLREWVREGTTPPQSRIAGRIDNGGLVIDVVGGTTTSMPVREDPAIDGAAFGPMVTVQTIGPAETQRWQAVTAALPHENDAIVPPTIACRLGGHQARFFHSVLSPFPPATLNALYGRFEGYKSCVEETVAGLEAARLYDPRVESAKETADLARPLFGP